MDDRKRKPASLNFKIGRLGKLNLPILVDGEFHILGNCLQIGMLEGRLGGVEMLRKRLNEI